MNTSHGIVETPTLGGRRFGSRPQGRWHRTLLASTAALSLGAQNAAWATCSDGTTFPAGGFVVGSPALPSASNWSPKVFTAAAGSLFIPDTSVNEQNDPAQPLTGGGHNWAFDQGTAFCKQTDVGVPNGATTGWTNPSNTSADCAELGIFRGDLLVGLGDIPFHGEAITPTCDPALLSTPTVPNPANTYFNQLGCSIYHGVKTDAQHASTYVFVASGKGTLLYVRLDLFINQTVGAEAGSKQPGFGGSNYSAIPPGQQLTHATVSKDGQFVVATSNKKQQSVYACLNPLGDPGDPTKPINSTFAVPPAGTVQCMSVGNNNLAVDQATAFGPDNQPYFAGQHTAASTVNSFDVTPGGTSKSAWPNCIWQNNGSTSLADAFAHKRTNGCGNAQPNTAFPESQFGQPNALISHGSYMYSGPVSGSVVQIKMTVDPKSGLSQYSSRTYLTGIANVTGLGVTDDLGSLMVFTDPSIVGLPGQEVVTKLPLCEDLP